MLEHPFEQRVAYAGAKHVFYKQTHRYRQQVNLVALARMSLHALQKELLVQFANIMTKKPAAMDSDTASNIRRLLHEYCDALRDREYMTETTKSGVFPNPFVLLKRNFMDETLINDLENGLRVDPHDWAFCPHAGDEFDELPGGPWDPKTREQTKYARYSMALLGSLILVGPMILMVLIKGVIVRLVTAGTCTIIFAFALAKLSTRTPFELMSATAAYTAVLVVFVGTSTGS